MKELFKTEQSLSPREKWLRKHGVFVHENDECDEPWSAWSLTETSLGQKPDANPVADILSHCTHLEERGFVGYGQSRLDAIGDLARAMAKQGVPCWRTDGDCR